MKAQRIIAAGHGHIDPSIADNDPQPVVDMRRDRRSEGEPAGAGGPGYRLLDFLAELRRRQVCRTIAMYAVALWLVCQVVDVVSGPLALPDWTLRFVIVLGLIGLPVAIILAWFFDVTRDVAQRGAGNTVSVASHSVRRPLEQLLDCALVAVAVAIAAQLALGGAPAAAGDGQGRLQQISVLPFQAASGDTTLPLSYELTNELQYRLTTLPGMKVVVARDPFTNRAGYSVTGVISSGPESLRVIVTLVDNGTMEILWSRAIERAGNEGPWTLSDIVAEIIRDISQFNTQMAADARGD